MTARSFLGRMFIVNIVLAVSIALACLAFSGVPMGLGAGVGGLLGALNLFLLGSVVLWMMTPGARRIVPVILLVAKLVVLLAAIVVVIRVIRLDAFGLAAGFTSTVLAVLLCSAVVVGSGREIQI